jgi:glycosyltransferase involved in cell wall biosynthesis
MVLVPYSIGPAGEKIPWSSVSVIIPAFNEGRSIATVVRDISALGARVIVVDDGSTDQTSSIAAAAGAVVLRHCLNRGQGASLQTGIRYALRCGAEFLVTFDADGQHSVEDIERLLVPLVRDQADVALGSRFLGHAYDIPMRRRMTLWAAVLFTRLASGMKVTDAHNGIRALTADVGRNIHLQQDRMAHASELMDEISRFRVAELPVKVSYSEYSMSKGQRDTAALRILLDYLVGRWTR